MCNSLCAELPEEDDSDANNITDIQTCADDSNNNPVDDHDTNVTDIQTDADSNNDSVNMRVSKGRGVKRRWTDEEHSVVIKHFANNIMNKKMPKGPELTKALHQLPHRTVAQLRTYVHNYLSGKVKLM